MKNKKKKEIILAVDPWSNKYWIAIFEWWKLIHNEQVYVQDVISEITFDNKIFYFWEHIQKLKKKFDYTKIIHERSHAHRNALIKIWELTWVMRYFSALYKLEEDVEWFSAMTIKKYITWTWRASKEEVQEAVSERFGIEEIWEDEADAIALWAYYQEWILWIELDCKSLIED